MRTSNLKIRLCFEQGLDFCAFPWNLVHWQIVFSCTFVCKVIIVIIIACGEFALWSCASGFLSLDFCLNQNQAWHSLFCVFHWSGKKSIYALYLQPAKRIHLILLAVEPPTADHCCQHAETKFRPHSECQHHHFPQFFYVSFSFLRCTGLPGGFDTFAAKALAPICMLHVHGGFAAPAETHSFLYNLPNVAVSNLCTGEAL